MLVKLIELANELVGGRFDDLLRSFHGVRNLGAVFGAGRSRWTWNGGDVVRPSANKQVTRI